MIPMQDLNDLKALELYQKEIDRLRIKYLKKGEREEAKARKLYEGLETEQDLEDAYGYDRITEKQLEEGKRRLAARDDDLERQKQESVTQKMLGLLCAEARDVQNSIFQLKEDLGVKPKDPEMYAAVAAKVSAINKAHGLN